MGLFRERVINKKDMSFTPVTTIKYSIAVVGLLCCGIFICLCINKKDADQDLMITIVILLGILFLGILFAMRVWDEIYKNSNREKIRKYYKKEFKKCFEEEEKNSSEMEKMLSDSDIPKGIKSAEIELKIEQILNDQRNFKESIGFLGTFAALYKCFEGKNYPIIPYVLSAVIIFLIMSVACDVAKRNQIEDTIRQTAQQDYIEMHNKKDKI